MITTSCETKKSLSDCKEFLSDPNKIVPFLETAFGINGIKTLEEGKTYSGKARIGGTEYNTTVTYQGSFGNKVKYQISTEKFKLPVSINLDTYGKGTEVEIEVDSSDLPFMMRLAAPMIQSKLGEGLKAFINAFEKK